MKQDDKKLRSPTPPSEREQQEKDTVRPPAIPRPDDVHPSHALTDTPPPADLFVEETPTKLMMHQDIIKVLADASESAARKAEIPGGSTTPSAPPSGEVAGSSRPPKRTTGPPRPELPRPSQQRSYQARGIGKSAPPRAPLSLMPSSPNTASEPEVSCASATELRERGLAEPIRQRIEALELQAQLQRDPVHKARLLVLASELHAMLGQTPRARHLAEQASKLGSYVAQRQARQLAQTQGDTKGAASYLGAEVHTAPNATVRSHAAVTHAEFERLQNKDPLAAGRSLEHAQRSSPLDPRPGLFKLARQLGASPKPPSFKWPDEKMFQSLTWATAATMQLRGDTRARLSEDSPPVAVFLDVQRALARRDRQAAASSLLLLRNQPGFQRSVPWLCAALFAPLPETRPQAAELLRDMLRDRPTRAVRRALAARALELGDAQSAALALQEKPTSDNADVAFSLVDQLAIAALCHTNLQEVLNTIADLGAEEDVRPLMHAAAICAAAPALAPTLGGVRSDVLSACYDLAQGNAQLQPPSPPSVNLSDLPQDDEPGARADSPGIEKTHPLLAALSREYAALSSNDVEVLCELLVSIPQPNEANQTAHFHYAAALTAEHLSERDRAIDHYTQALEEPDVGEAALRALIDLLGPARTTPLLEQFAAGVDDGEKKTLLLAQAALSVNSQTDRLRLCQASIAACADHVVTEALLERFGSHAACGPDAEPTDATGDEASVLGRERISLLGRRALHAETPFERALAYVRQVYPGHAAADAAERLEQAWSLWPKDLGLLDLREQYALLPLEVMARGRETLADTLKPCRSAISLRLESALFYELAGLAPNAAQVAESVASDDALAALCFARTAPGTEYATKLREWVTHQAHVATTEPEQADWWLLAARLASDAGAHAAEREAIMQAVVLNPRHLEALLTAESLAFREGALARIADIEKRLAEILQGQALDAHAQMSARFEQLEHGWAAGYPALQLCDKGDHTPLYAVRGLLSLARRAGDDERTYRMLAVLLRQSGQPHDQAVLLVHSAEVALRLGKQGSALTHLDDAVALAPKYESALACRAHLLAAQGYQAAAAEAYERLAFAASSRELQGEAFKQAALQLLNETESVPQADDKVSAGSDRPAALRVADPTRLKINLERALEAVPDDDESLDLLTDIYIQQSAQQELDQLFERRLTHATSEQRTSVELRWSDACAKLGSSHRARDIVDAVLQRSPEHPEALSQLVELATEDAPTREQALLQLVRVTADPLKQSAAYKQLGHFYRHTAPQPARAVRCFQEACKRNPSDRDAFQALVEVTVEQGAFEDAEAAIAAFSTQGGGDAHERVVALARATVLTAQKPEHGERVFGELLARWPLDEDIISGAVRLFGHTNQDAKLQSLMSDLRRQAVQQLPSGELVGKCLASLSHLSALMHDKSAQTLTMAVSNFFHEAPSGMDARGSRAMSRSLDAILAPPPMGTALLSLLAHTTLAMERALPLDVEALQASELNDPRVRASFDMKARAMGQSTPALLVVRKQPYACMVTHEPARVVLGSAWVDLSSPSALDFLTWRALKVLQARLGPIAHLPAAALMSHVEALLSAYVDTTGSELSTFHSANLTKRLHPQLPKDPELVSVAEQALNDLGSSECTCSEAIALWMDRCALLAVGELRAAVHGIAMLHGELPPPRSGGVVDLLQRVPQANRLVASVLSADMAAGHRAIH